ncbi:hypothetical protein F511_34085 [Dorcoceras hygrometricum]|uniref:Uncharacterized protein n=1 Tax=Dorcoceras hygrometricum TaxID=472368 RepID=A0A2Z7B443_9LAMI|nr:hypothetical protein F511_34085 [Dorcoceras hygrometricum]
MSCARWIVPEGVAFVSCKNMQVGSDVREDGSAGATEPAGGGQIRPAAVIFAKGAAAPAGTLKDQAGPAASTVLSFSVFLLKIAKRQRFDNLERRRGVHSFISADEDFSRYFVEEVQQLVKSICWRLRYDSVWFSWNDSVLA